MTTFEQEKQARSELEQALEDLLEVDIQTLVRSEELGMFSFEEAEPYIERTLSLFRDLQDCNLEGVPQGKLDQLKKLAMNAKERLSSFSEFNPTEVSNPQNQHQELIDQLQRQWSTYYEHVTPVIAFRSRQEIDLDALERQAEGTVTRLEREASEFDESREEAEGKIASALERVREAAAEAGVSQEAIYFEEEASAHETISWVWLGAAVLFGLSVLLYVFFALEPKLLEATQEGITTQRLLSLAVARIIVVSILTFGLVWSARNFSRSRHNYVVNRHRRNALSAFQTFVEATGDPQVKDAVLLQATRSIFAPQPTGYSRSEAEPQSRNQLVEIMTRLSDSGTDSE